MPKVPYRMRTRTSPTPEERELHRQLVLAENALLKADQVCKHIGKQDSFTNRRSLMAAKKIQEAIRSIGEIGNLTSSIDASDPDLMSEKQRTALFKEKRNARLEKHKKARQRRAEHKQKAGK